MMEYAQPVVMAVGAPDADAFHRRAYGRSPHQMHAFRPDVFLVADPQAAGYPAPEHQTQFEPMHHDFFSDTFGQEMARNMHNMEREMQEQMRSMSEMQR